jgi:copper/silver efflux system protein
MSLAGIAIAIGVLVDAAIVVTENVIRHCETPHRGRNLGRHPRRLQASWPPDFLRDGDHHSRVRAGVRAGGAGGQIVPSARMDETFAMVGSTLLGVTLVPVLCSLLVRGPYHSEDRNIVMRLLLKFTSRR